MRSIRQPEYTGENRCLPCTVVNLFIALVADIADSAESTDRTDDGIG